MRTGEERCEPVSLVQEARRGACGGVVRQAAVQVPRQQLAQGRRGSCACVALWHKALHAPASMHEAAVWTLLRQM